MTQEDFKHLLNARIASTITVLATKNKEYSRNGDKLHNFKSAARMQKVTPERALLGMLSKHLVSVIDMIHDLDDPDWLAELATPEIQKYLTLWEEKIGDSINYLILLEALVAERLAKPPSEEEEDKIPF